MATGQLGTILRHLHRLVGLPACRDLSDRQLLERFAAGRDEAAFATLLRRHGPMVLGVCWRVLRQTQDAEAAFQATFLVLAKKAGSVPWQESVRGWLYEVAYRVAAEAKRASQRRKARERHPGTPPQPSPGQEAARRELSAVLEEELYRLPERWRGPLVLCCLEGKTRDEAARLLGCSLRTRHHGGCCDRRTRAVVA